MAIDRVRIPLKNFSVQARGGTELFLSGYQPSNTAIVDLSVWPPRVTVHANQSGFPAARSISGIWLIHVLPDADKSRAWVLRYYSSGSATPTEEIAVPLPPTDLTPVFAVMDEKQRGYQTPGELYRIESLHFFGDRPLLVPRHVGLSGRNLPIMLDASSGEWREERSLPEFTKTPEQHGDQCVVKTVRLGDGSDLLVWDCGLFEWDGRGFARTFEHRLQCAWYERWEPVPVGFDGVFCLNDERLIELHRGGGEPRVHLPKVRVRELKPGPNHTLMFSCGLEHFIFDPVGDTLCRIPRAWLAKGTQELYADPEQGFLVIFNGRTSELVRYSAEELEQLPKCVASLDAEDFIYPKPPRPTPLSKSGSASRPTVAAAEQLILCTGNEVRAHTVDAPTWRVRLAAEVVGVAAVPGRVFALDAKGTLHTLNPMVGSVEHSIDVAPSPRSLCVSADGVVAVLAANAVHLLSDGVPRRTEFEAPITAAFDPSGTLLVVGEHGRAALIERDGQVKPLPEPPRNMMSVAALDVGVWLGVAESGLLRFESSTRSWSMVEQGEPGTYVAVSPNRTCYAWCDSLHTASVVHLDGSKGVWVSYPNAFSMPEEEPLDVTGVAFLDEKRVVVALGKGRANILEIDSGNALKLDPQPGDSLSRWVFTYGGKILIAG
jgi:hypothetical protein